MTLTLDFQGQILKKSNLRNGMADRHGTKGMWVDRMLDSHCDFKLWPHPWPWPWIFKVKYWNCCNLGMGGSTHMEWKGCELDMMLDAQWDWPWATVHGKWISQVMGQYELYSFQPVGQCMDYSFPDLGAEGCCRSLNALLDCVPTGNESKCKDCQWIPHQTTGQLSASSFRCHKAMISEACLLSCRFFIK